MTSWVSIPTPPKKKLIGLTLKPLFQKIHCPFDPWSGETASPKLAEELSPAESGAIVQTEHETLPDKPDEPDA